MGEPAKRTWVAWIGLATIGLTLGAPVARAEERLPPTPRPVLAPQEFSPPPPVVSQPIVPGEADPGCPITPGWFAAVEAAVLAPRIEFGRANEVSADLNATVSPRVELGYRFSPGNAVRLAYRFVGASSDEFSTDGFFTQRERQDLQVHWIDLDYVSTEYRPLPCWDVRWEAGARLVSRSIRSRGDSAFFSADQQDQFIGIGPHAAVQTAWTFAGTGLAAFGRLDLAVPFGRSELDLDLRSNSPFIMMLPVQGDRDRSITELDLILQLGLRWTYESACCGVRLTGGLQFEGWSFGSCDCNQSFLLTATSVGAAGPFVRCEIAY